MWLWLRIKLQEGTIKSEKGNAKFCLKFVLVSLFCTPCTHQPNGNTDTSICFESERGVYVTLQRGKAQLTAASPPMGTVLSVSCLTSALLRQVRVVMRGSRCSQSWHNGTLGSECGHLCGQEAANTMLILVMLKVPLFPLAHGSRPEGWRAALPQEDECTLAFQPSVNTRRLWDHSLPFYITCSDN